MSTYSYVVMVMGWCLFLIPFLLIRIIARSGAWCQLASIDEKKTIQVSVSQMGKETKKQNQT